MVIFGGFFSCLLPIFRQTQTQNIIPLTSSFLKPRPYPSPGSMLSQASGGGHGENESMFNMFMIGFTSSSSLRTQSSFTLWIDFDMSRSVVHPLSSALNFCFPFQGYSPLALGSSALGSALPQRQWKVSEMTSRPKTRACTPRIQWCETSLYARR